MSGFSDTARPDLVDFGRVAVVMGGWAAEREVSLMSGRQVLDALLASGVDATALDAERDVVAVLQRDGYDRAFLILHGRGGEDGLVQGALELAGIPYTGTGVLGSALAMDKFRSKELCSYHGVPTATAERLGSVAEVEAAVARIGLPAVIKPVAEGSSIGVSMVQGTQQLAPAFDTARQHGDVMIEQYLAGSEVTCAVLHERCLPLVSIRAPGEFYDYDAKYIDDDTEYSCPAPLDAALTERIQQLALQVFAILACRGWARIDFMLDAAGEPQFMECNTAPGMTSHSLVPVAAGAAGIDFPTLCLEILSTSMTTGERAA